MKTLSKFQFTLIAFSVLLILFFVIFFADKKPEQKEISEIIKNEKVSFFDLKDYVSKKAASLPDSLKDKFKKLDKEVNSKSTDSVAFSNMIKFWDRLFMYDVSAYYSGLKAEFFPDAKNWFNGGDRFLSSIQFVKDEKLGTTNRSLPEVLLVNAVFCLEKGLKSEPNNIEAKIKLASCYLEDKTDPMKGISLLREIEKTDSNNVNLQLTFAFASVKSGQLDKAVLRFKKVLVLDPENLSVYLYLADVYERQGNKVLVIETLEEYALKVPDADAKKEIRKYIDKLKNS